MKTPAPLSQLILKHAGLPALVIGGGVSAPAQAKAAPSERITISANQHGALLGKCDYIVACDNKPGVRYIGPSGKEEIDLRAFAIPVISPREQMADYRIFKTPVNLSGATAAFVAWALGCAPIILAGMDCYSGGTYWHSPKALSTGSRLPLNAHLTKWRMLQNLIPNAMLRPVSGPLTAVFPKYDSSESLVALSTRDEIFLKLGGVMVRDVRTGKIKEVSKTELSRGLRRRELEVVPG